MTSKKPRARAARNPLATDLREQKQSEQILAEGLLARSVLEQAADAIVVCDDKGQITRVSRTAEQLCGCSPLRASFDAAFPVVLASPLLGGGLTANALTGAVLRAEPATLTRVDGSKADLLLSATPLQTADGRIIGCVITMVDVSEHRRADEALRASEARFRSVLEESRDIIYRVDVPTGRYEYISPSVETTVGFAPDELMAMDLETSQATIHADDAPAIRAAVARLETAGEADVEYRQKTKDGNYRWLSNHMSLIKDSLGRPLYRNGNIRDITESKQAEAQREVLLAELKAIVASMPDGLITYRQGAPGATINPAAHRILGVPAEDWPRTIAERARFMQVRNEAGLPVDADATPAARALRGETVASEIMRFQRPDGEERWISVGAAPIITAAGEQIGALTLFSDITNRKRAEEALERSKQKLAEVLDSIQDDFYVLDRDWKFTFASKRFTSRIGKQPEDFLGNNIWEMFPKHVGTVYEENLRAAMDKRKTRRFEIGGKYTDAWYRMTASPSAEGITVLGTEITENKKVEEALREADQRKNEFLAMLSHELRNPLAPIRNSAYILEHSAPGGEQAKRALAVIDRQAGQLAHLVDDLLDVTRITRNKIQLQRNTLELNELVRHTAEDHRTLFDRADVRVELHPASQPMFVSADRNRLVQVIGNLLQNAAKFTGRGGETRITITADATERRAVIQVADTGVGMAPELVERLFQPFSQADSTLDRSKGGLGLGLALAKGLVDLHGGDITARSAGLGQGAEFVVRLPLAKEDAVAPRPAATAGKGRRRVLIIEDNVDAADSLRDVLAFGEHEVEVAYNGPQGIAKAQEFRPDIVFCDIGLPIMDGYEVARAFRADDTLKGAFLVALSGYAMPEDLERASAAGFERHLAKPPSLEKLEEILASR